MYYYSREQSEAPEYSDLIPKLYLLFLEHISANDSSADTILVAATGPGTRSRRSIRAQQQSTKTQICNTNNAVTGCHKSGNKKREKVV